MQTFDLIVIGSGPAGQRAAIQAAKAGKRVTLIEKREFLGGACINTGTIPSKTMREAVLHLSGFHYQNIYGINYRVKEKITMSDLLFRVQHVIKTEVDVTQAQLTRNGVEVLTGTASFVDPTHLRVVNALGQIDLEGGAAAPESPSVGEAQSGGGCDIGISKFDQQSGKGITPYRYVSVHEDDDVFKVTLPNELFVGALHGRDLAPPVGRCHQRYGDGWILARPIAHALGGLVSAAIVQNAPLSPIKARR